VWIFLNFALATRIQRAVVLGWLDGPAGFRAAHASLVNEATTEPLIVDDWVVRKGWSNLNEP
jgi:hypothetical protein